jgi:hypothetical protein
MILRWNSWNYSILSWGMYWLTMSNCFYEPYFIGLRFDYRYSSNGRVDFAFRGIYSFPFWGQIGIWRRAALSLNLRRQWGHCWLEYWADLSRRLGKFLDTFGFGDFGGALYWLGMLNMAWGGSRSLNPVGGFKVITGGPLLRTPLQYSALSLFPYMWLSFLCANSGSFGGISSWDVPMSKVKLLSYSGILEVLFLWGYPPYWLRRYSCFLITSSFDGGGLALCWMSWHLGMWRSAAFLLKRRLQ